MTEREKERATEGSGEVKRSVTVPSGVRIPAGPPHKIHGVIGMSEVNNGKVKYPGKPKVTYDNPELTK